MTWGELTLGEVVEIKHGWAFKGEYFSDAGELILLTPGNVFETGGLKLKGDKEKYYTGEFPEEFLLESGDMIVVMTDLIQNAPILGASLIIPEDNRYLHNQRLGLVKITDPSRIDYKFLYYVFNSPIYRGQIRGSATGATVRHTAPKRIYACKVPYPIQISEQKKIAGILSAYDDLIDNNNRRIALLEEAIHRLYREWFVHLRFPGHEHTPVVDGVPEGWEKVKISDLYDTSSGGTPSRKVPEYFGGDIPWVKTKELQDRFLISTEENITEFGLKNSSAKIFPENTVIMAMYGATIGQLGILTVPATTNQACCALLAKESPFGYAYAFAYLKGNRDYILSHQMGAAQQNISQQIIRKLDILKPDNALVTDFNAMTEPMLEQIMRLQKMNNRLAEARDSLLPRLMNGSLPV